MLGGIAAGEEFHSGYMTAGLLHDTSGVRMDAIKMLSLEKFGLKIISQRPEYALLSKDGKAIVIKDDPLSTSETIKSISESDAA